MLPFIDWKDFYSVGDPSLDAQHKQVFGAINELYEAIQQDRDRAVLKPILDRLVQYTVTHFQCEEQIMRECGYPEFSEHKILHEKMRQKTIDWRDHVNQVTGHDLLLFLKEWWVGHIQGCDKKYSPYLALSGSRR